MSVAFGLALPAAFFLTRATVGDPYPSPGPLWYVGSIPMLGVPAGVVGYAVGRAGAVAARVARSYGS